jgi:hypothetical protein
MRKYDLPSIQPVGDSEVLGGDIGSLCEVHIKGLILCHFSIWQLKKSELYSSIWASYDVLRGGMNASQYMGYVLVLFVNYVSDKYPGQKNPPYLAGPS